MSFILVDTSVFLRLESQYKDAYYCFLSTSDVIAVTKQIENEYKGRAYADIYLLLTFLQKLEREGKLRRFKRSYIDSHVRRHHRRINYPSHEPDKKWIDVAIAVRARYIISTNSHLLNITSNLSNNDNIETMLPSQYTEIQCPEE